MWVNSSSTLRARGCLWEYAGAVSESITDGRSELPEYLSEGLLKVVVDDHVLVITKSRRREL